MGQPIRVYSRHETYTYLGHKFNISGEWEGGLGVPNVEWTYTTTRLTHLIRMLNNDDAAVRELARASLLLDLRRRKVPLANTGQENFLGFRRKGNGKLDIQAAGCGCRSDWPDLNDLCNRAADKRKDKSQMSGRDDGASQRLTK
ncbi:unnamed protein product [Pleuronectes platessa]|uniref:Uncharacterized protein n=1 Tax=Pleuronectes platessa TaxID=8262 RepID=A0A9N7U087_PLEPL|nr:unnamed protein product [Pleuronectes platessa]